MRGDDFALKSHALPNRRSSTDPSCEELDQLRQAVERLERDNARLRSRVLLDEQLGSDAARYEVIVANLAEGIVLQRADGQILACNAAAERILGLSVDQIAGRTSLDPRWRAIHEDGSAFPGDTHPAMVSLRTGEPLRDVVMGVHKPDGSLTWISISSQPLFGPDNDGDPHAVVASFVDITHYKRSEARARDSEETLRFALHAARMGTFEWDLTTNEIQRSENVEAILGLEPGSFPSTYQAYLPLVHPEDRSEFEAAITNALTRVGGNDDLLIEHRIVGPNGTTRWIGSSSQVIRNERGAPVKIAGTVTDISARKSLENQLMLSQRMETVGRLVGGVAHDFNNLLMAILGCAEFVGLRPNLAPEIYEAVETIREASEKAAGLTRQLLSFARKQVFDLEVVDLRDLVADNQRLLSRVLGETIEIATALSDVPVEIRADRGQIEQVLINLAINARDAMPAGGRLDITVAKVSVDASRGLAVPAGNYALLELRDHGQGIAANTLPHIFDPFFTTKSDGTGLGLSTCYGIVKQLGGEIIVDSEPGKGTRFAIYLPITSGGHTPARADDRRPPLQLEGGRILLAEDDAVVRMIAERGLRAHGYEVLAVADGPAALDLVARDFGKIDLLVSDVVMPKMSGYELATRLREQLPELGVVFVSGYADGGSEFEVPGAVSLPKPYTITRLAEVVGEMLAK